MLSLDSGRLYLCHDAEPVASPYLLDVAVAVAALEQLDGEVDQL